jgi:hypothetical protein
MRLMNEIYAMMDHLNLMRGSSKNPYIFIMKLAREEGDAVGK